MGKQSFSDFPESRRLRHLLLESIAEKGITSPAVLFALEIVPRHWFVPISFTLEEAYADYALPIGERQTISQPYTVAYQTELLDVQPEQKILEIGTGSGYQAAVLYQMGVDLYSIEFNKVLYQKTKSLFQELGYPIHLFYGDGSQGLSAYAPFDRILMTAGTVQVPEILLQQLQVGGKLVLPVGKPKMQRMTRITRKKTQVFDTETFDLFSFVPLRGKYGTK